MTTNQQQQTTGQRATFNGDSAVAERQQQRRRGNSNNPNTAAALDEELSKLAAQLGTPVNRRTSIDLGSSPSSTSLNGSFTDITHYTPGVHSFSFRAIGDDISQDQVDAIHGGSPRVQNSKTMAAEFLRQDDAGSPTYVD